MDLPKVLFRSSKIRSTRAIGAISVTGSRSKKRALEEKKSSRAGITGKASIYGTCVCPILQVSTRALCTGKSGIVTAIRTTAEPDVIKAFTKKGEKE